MPRKLSLLLSLVFTFAFTLSALAQGTPEPGLDGLQGAYGRIYMADMGAVMATAGAGGTPDLAATPLIGRVAVYTFEDTAAAEANVERLAAMTAEEAAEGASTQKDEVDDIGDTAYQYTAKVEPEGGMTADMTLLVVQEGEHVFMAAVVGGTDPATMARSWVEFMLDGEVGDEEITLAEDGTSSGGVFDLMPNADDAELLGGMLPMADLDLLNVADE